MHCPNCGTQNASNYKFCQKCGTKLPQTTVQSVNSQPNTTSTGTVRPNNQSGSVFDRVQRLFHGVIKDDKLNRNKPIILALAGIVTICAVIFIFVFLLRSSNKSIKPDHYGVYLKVNTRLIELQELEIFDMPVESDGQPSTTIKEGLEPKIVVWRDNVILDYLEIYKLGKYLNEEKRIEYQASKDKNGVITIVPSANLERGIYCIVQGNPLSVFLPGWCFQVGTGSSSQPLNSPVPLVLEPTTVPRKPTAVPLPTQMPIENYENSIKIWKVGSPYRGDTPENLIPIDMQMFARSEGYQVVLETMPAQGFAQKFFDAMAQNTEPDILSFDNYGIIEGAKTDLGSFDGIDTDLVKSRMVFVANSFNSLQVRGWVVLFSSSSNFKQAKAMAFKELQCGVDYPQSISDNLRLMPIARKAVTAHHQKDKTSLDEIAGGFYSTNSLDSMPFSDQIASVKDVILCDYWGNQNMAFMDVLVSFDGPMRIGNEHMFLLFDDRDLDWQLVQLTNNINNKRVTQLLKDLGTFNESEQQIVNGPELVSPNDNFVNPRKNTVDLTWKSDGAGTRSYLVETKFCWNDQNLACSASIFNLTSPQPNTELEVKSTIYPSQPYRWRIWAIDNSGQFYPSEWRTIYVN